MLKYQTIEQIKITYFFKMKNLKDHNLKNIYIVLIIQILLFIDLKRSIVKNHMVDLLIILEI
jgi:hypothetical protein